MLNYLSSKLNENFELVILKICSSLVEKYPGVLTWNIYLNHAK